MKLIDLQLNIDGLILNDNEDVESFIEKLNSIINSNYDIKYEILYEERYD